MKIKTNSGFSLVGTLAVSLGTLTIGLGALKLNLNALNTAKIESTKVSEEVLKQTVIKILSTTEACTDNLKPNQIDNQTFSLKDSTLQSSNIEVNTGLFNEVINIVDMKLQDDPDNSNKKLFYLYYSKPALGDKQTKGGNICKKSDPPEPTDDLIGCYYLSCEIDYECTGGTCNKCNVNVQKCNFEGNQPIENRQTCEQNKLRTKSDINFCADIPAIFLKNMNHNLNDQEYIYGFAGFNENKEPQFVKLLKVCPPGQYPVRVMVENDEDEVDIECQILCTGGSTLDAETNLCKCPLENPALPLFENGKCKACPPGRDWIESESKCAGCPTEKPHHYINKCIQCPSDAVWSTDNKECVCNNHNLKWNSDNENCECRPPFYIDNNNCIKCHYPKRLVGSSCQCIGNRTWDPQTRTCKCPNNKWWDPIQEICTCGGGTYISNGRCCPNGTRNDNGKCCPPGTRNDNGKCCPPGKHNSNGRCCPNGKHYTSGGLCCNSGEYNAHGICCPKNWRNDRGTCCPTGKYNDGGLCCPYGKENANGICCRYGYVNANGRCCPPGSGNAGGICCPHARINNGICCPTGSVNASGICCPYARLKSNGRCCPDDRWIQSTNTCCWEGELKTSDGRCCPPHRYNNNNGTCCPIGKVNNNGICCLPDSFILNGKCCPPGSRNDGGICCKNDHSNINGECCKPDPNNPNLRYCCRAGRNVHNGGCCENGFYNAGGTCCQDGSILRNGSCMMTCSSTQYFDSLNNRCLNCPAGATGNGSQCRCPGGRSWNRNNNTCN